MPRTRGARPKELDLPPRFREGNGTKADQHEGPIIMGHASWGRRRHHQALDPGKITLFTILLLWSLPWKAASTWRAARNGSKPWFVVLFVTNTAGILDALYLFKLGAHRRGHASSGQSRSDQSGSL